MNALTLGTTSIRQLDGLYSLNDLHASAGGEKRHQPSDFLRIAQTQELISELSSEDSRNIHTKTVIGKGKQQGTYVCRELVFAYANWISPAFYLKMIRAFDNLQKNPGTAALPGPKEKISRELRAHINRTAHQVALKQYDTIHSILTDCATDNLACGATEEACFGYVEAFGSLSDGVAIANIRDLKELVYVVGNVIDAAGSAIATIRRIEQRSGFQLHTRIERSKWESPDFHKHDRLVQEVIERISE